MGEFDLGNTYIESSSISIESDHDSNYNADEGVTAKLFREGHMISSGVGGAFVDTAKDPLSKAPDLALAGSAGVGIRMLQRGGTKGRAMAGAIGGVMALKMVVDEYTGDRWSMFGKAVEDNWNSAENYDRNVAITKSSAGAFAVDTTVAVAGFKASGTKTGSRLLFGEGSTKMGNTNPSWVGREAKPINADLYASIRRAGDGKLGAGTRPPMKSASLPLEAYQQAGYRYIPPRTVSSHALADGVKVGPSTKPLSNKAAIRGGVQYMEARAAAEASLRTGNSAWVGRQAQLLEPAVIDAALAEATGIKPTTKSVTVKPVETYQQTGYRHIPPRDLSSTPLADGVTVSPSIKPGVRAAAEIPGSTSNSALNGVQTPATELLIRNSIPITSTSRAVAANLNLQQSPPWLVGAKVRGGIKYMEARAATEASLGTGNSPWVGRQAQLLEPAVIDAALAEATGIKPTTKSVTVKPVETYQQTGYRHIPPRDLSSTPLADGVTVSPSIKPGVRAAAEIPGSTSNSALNGVQTPATELLIRNSIPITSTSRAVAANLNLQQSPPWLVGAKVRGGIKYMESRAAAETSIGTSKSPWIGKEAPVLKPAAVDAVMAEAAGNSSVFRGNVQ